MPTELPALPRGLDLTSQLGKRPSPAADGEPASRGRGGPPPVVA